MKVSIIIPNYNGEKYIGRCLRSLGAQTVRDFGIIVVDNGSDDKSREIINMEFEELRRKGFMPDRLILIRHPQNSGFCGGVNAGIKCADTEYVILLNNDTEADKDFVRQSLKAMSGSKKIFSASPKMLCMDNREIIDNAGDGYTVMGWAFPFGLDEKSGNYDKPRVIFSACAGAAIYRRSVFDEIGLFDENHFAYLEDVDIGWRAKIYGYKNIYNPNAVVYHVGSASTGSRHNEFKIRNAARNNIYLLYKNMPFPLLLLHAPLIAAGCAVKYAFFRKMSPENGKAYLTGIAQGFKNLGKCEKVKHERGRLGIYMGIEADMALCTAAYVKKMIRSARRFKIEE